MTMASQADFLAALRYLMAYQAFCEVEQPMLDLVANYFGIDSENAHEVLGVIDPPDEEIAA